MRNLVLLFFLIFSLSAYTQVKRSDRMKISDENISNSKNETSNSKQLSSPNSHGKSSVATRSNETSLVNDSIAPIDWYKIISYNNKVTEVDTTLTIKKFQKLNFLGRDLFGLQSNANDGQSYNILDYSLIQNNVNPSFGFEAKQINYYQIEDINYYKVPTPFTELTYRSVVKQGQNLNSLFTSNFNERLNIFVGYRALRSLGAYINELNSIGNFKLGGSYNTKNKRYYLRANVVVQDVMNQENGGITDIDFFQSSEAPYNNRERLNVYFRNAFSMLKGMRFYLDHKYKFNKSTDNEIWFKQQIYYDYKSNEYTQEDISTVDSNVIYFGDAYSNSIKDKVRFKNFYNKFSLAYNSSTFGEIAFNADVSTFDYYYNSIVVKNNSEIVPASLTYDLITIGGSYGFNREKFSFTAEARQSISTISTSEIKAFLDYSIAPEYKLKASYKYLSKIPEMTQQLFQSSYVNYNWINHFSNEKIQSIEAVLENPFVNLSGNFQLINDKIYFSNNSLEFDTYGNAIQQLITPKQYTKPIGYFNIKAHREFKFGKFALDNTLLFQQVSQDQNIVNVPSFITRNTFYYSDHVFKKAMFIQTGIVFNYHTKYFANEYNPLIGDYFVQDSRKVGGFPTFDFFINAKIKTARIYLNVEHFNASLAERNYFATPTRPFTDMRLRFGIVWDFFW